MRGIVMSRLRKSIINILIHRRMNDYVSSLVSDLLKIREEGKKKNAEDLTKYVKVLRKDFDDDDVNTTVDIVMKKRKK
jgi:hypothetical protein